MSYLMHITFDNTRRLKKNIYYFSYKNVIFKLIQNNPRIHSDVLLTIVSKSGNIEEENAYSAASEFLSALSWEINSQIIMSYSGGYGWDEKKSLRYAKQGIYIPPVFPVGRGRMLGYDLNEIPAIINSEQITALTLYREAHSSNNPYLSFLFYWQILDVYGTKAATWTNNIFKKNVSELQIKEYLSQINLQDKPLGDYLEKECRDAIAHIKRAPNKTRIDLDSAKDNQRILIAVKIVQKLAEVYIKKHLNLNKSCFLVKKNNWSYPEYVCIN